MLMSEASAERAIGKRPMGTRRPVSAKPVRVVAITSGKGGVGKTNVSVNLALALANEGKNIMLMDADFGLANVDVLLGVHATHNLKHVISGELSLEEIIVEGPSGLKIVPASSGTQAMAELNSAQHAGLIRAFSELSFNIDTLIIDTAAGITGSVISYSRAAQEVVVVLCDEPASLTDAYALLKLLNKEYGINRFHILANMVNSVQEGRILFSKLIKVTDRYLDVAMDFMGAIPQDDYLRKAVQKQRAVVDAYPRSKAAMAFKKLAQKTGSMPLPVNAGGHLEFFVERLIMASQEIEG